MLLGDLYSVYVNTIREPTLIFVDLKIISAHLALAHPSIFGERPIFQTIAFLNISVWSRHFSGTGIGVDISSR